MRTLPPLSKDEKHAQHAFLSKLNQYLAETQDPLQHERIKNVLTRNGFSPKLNMFEVDNISLGEFFQILELINDSAFTMYVMSYRTPHWTPNRTEAAALSEPKLVTPTLIEEPVVIIDPDMDTEFL